MFSSDFLKKGLQAPSSIAKIGEGIKSNTVDKLEPSVLTRSASFLTDRLPKIPKLSIPHLPAMPKLPKISMPKLPIPELPNIPLPKLPHIPMPHIPFLKDIFGILLGGLVGLIGAVSGGVLAIIGIIVAPLIILPSIWFFFLNDRNIGLALREYIGKGRKYYSGKVVWIVGASTSLGEAMALELSTVGAKIILSARRKKILDKLKTDCIENSKGKLSDSDILVLPFDVTQMDEENVQAVIREFGKIDVFIDNTGHTECVEACKVDIETERKVFDINFFGPAFLVKEVVKHFKETGGGEIIAVSSIAAKCGIPGQAAFSASKKALNGYFECLRHEASIHKIYLTTVCPGLIQSTGTDPTDEAVTSNVTQEEQLKMTRKGLKPKRVAHLVLVAGANRCTESWVSNQPFLFLTYLAQYNPWIHRFIMGFIFSKKRMEMIYKGTSPNIWMWRPLFVI